MRVLLCLWLISPVGDLIKGLPLTIEEADLQPVYDEIFAYVKGMFAKPVDYFSAERNGKIGFLSSLTLACA
jgi:hypothetical protein